MGLPTRACLTCKARRVKCDSARPTCARCWKAGRDCKWQAGDETGLAFRSENAFAQGRPRRPRGRKAGPAPSPGTMEAPGSSLSAAGPVRAALSFPLEMHALNYWMEYFGARPDDLPDIGHEYLTYVLPLWDAAGPDSCLYQTLSAVAHAVFGRARGVGAAIRDAAQMYSQAIAQLSAEIKNPPSEKIDQLLVSTMLLGFYENVMQGAREPPDGIAASAERDDVGSRFWQFVCHPKGADGLLGVRRRRRLPCNLALERAVRRQAMRVILLRGRITPESLSDGDAFGEEGAGLVLDALMVRVAALRARALPFFADSGAPSASLYERAMGIVAEAQKLDSSLDSWARNVPEGWRFSTQPCPEHSGPHEPAPPPCGYVHSYASHAHATVWNRYRVVRLITNSIRIRALEVLVGHHYKRPCVTLQQGLCQSTVDGLVDGLCASILFFGVGAASPRACGVERALHVGDCELPHQSKMLPKMAVMLAWPLTVAVSTEIVPQPQKDWLRGQLRTVSNSLGDAVLAAVADAQEFRF